MLSSEMYVFLRGAATERGRQRARFAASLSSASSVSA